MRIGLLALAGAMLGACCAFAQTKAVIPPAAEWADGSNGNAIPIGDYPSGTFQVMYASDLLAAIPVGSVITAMELRLSNEATTAFPPALRSLPKYDIRMATSTLTPATMGTNFAANMSGTVLVRSGAMNISAGAYPAGNSGTIPEAWGMVVPFTTPYTYNGGPLVVEFRTESPSAPIAHFADLFSVPGKMARGASASSTSATSSGTSVDLGLVIRLTYSAPSWELAHGVTKVVVLEEGVSSPGLTGSWTLIANTAKTSELIASAEHFDSLAPGSRIVSMAWRNRATGIWPPAPANYSEFSVQMARSLQPPSTASATIAANLSSWTTVTRSGPLSFAANSFPPMPTFAVNPWGPEVAFTKPFEYVQGPMAWVIQHSGQPQEEWALDAQVVGGAWYGEKVRAFAADGMGASVGTPVAAEITRLSIDAGAASPSGTEGPGADLIGGTIPPVLQTIIAASELRHIPPGSVIDSLWMRQLDWGTFAPETDVTATDFEVSLSTAARRPENISLSFAQNEGADKVLVHDGALVIPAGSMPPGGNDGRFGRIVQFRKNFVYKGGDVCITVRHTGLSAAPGRLEGLFGTEGFNRCVFSNSSGSSTGSLFFSGYSGMATRLGYIPSVMTPNSLATANGSGGWTTPSQSAYVVQVLIAADQLRSMDPGSVIHGMSLRQGSVTNSVSFPAAPTTVSRFDVTFSQTPNSPLTMSDTFASNIGAVARDVHLGPLTVPVTAFPSSGSSSVASENAWYVPFFRGYIYRGGDLCITIRGEGVLAAGGILDGQGSTPSARGATRYSYGSANATTGSAWGPPAIRLAFTPGAFCPWDLNNDGVVDDGDFTFFVQAYDVLDCADGAMAFGCPADFNYDRLVNDEDFVAFVGAYNELVCP